MQEKIEKSLDHADPEIITWREFSDWFSREGEVRDQVHTAQLYEIGLTRIYENEPKSVHKLSKKRTEYRVDHLVTINVKKGLNLLFIVFENRVANFYDVDR